MDKNRTVSAFDDLIALREKHGFRMKPGRSRSGHRWSRELIRKGDPDLELPRPLTPEECANGRPRNEPLYHTITERFPTFGWKLTTINDRNGKPQRVVEFSNYPTVGGLAPTLTDLLLAPSELFDNATESPELVAFRMRVGKPAGFAERRHVMEATGIGYKGLDGVTWRAGLEPFRLSLACAERLRLLARASFAFYDAVAECYGSDSGLRELVGYNVPQRIRPLVSTGSVAIIRPDIVLVADGADFRPVITELESAPAGHGMAHALQCGYGLPTAMVDGFIEYLAGRPYIAFATAEWAEYFGDQGAFVKALVERGVDARIIFDAPPERIAEAARSWKLPRDAAQEIRRAWNTDILGRMRTLGLDTVICALAPSELPENVGNAVVYRFGYFDNFPPETIDLLTRWQAAGATVINPISFYLESKTLLAVLQNDTVRQAIRRRGSEYLEALDDGVANTWLLSRLRPERFFEDRTHLISKFAAWDGNNQSWGSRSLVVGSQVSPAEWQRSLTERTLLPHPVVIQHAIASARFNILWADDNDRIQLLSDAKTRLTPFFLRTEGGRILDLGAMITLRSGTFRIHGALDAVEAPVSYV